MNNIMQNHSPDFYTKILNQIAEEIKILQNEEIDSKNKNVLDFHKDKNSIVKKHPRYEGVF